MRETGILFFSLCMGTFIVFAPFASAQIANGDFETGDLSNWTTTGDAFTTIGQESNSSWCEGWEGTYFAFSYGGGSESATGELQSDSFTLTSKYISFLSGGWSSYAGGGAGQDYNYLTLNLASDDSEIARCYMPNGNRMMPTLLDAGASNIGQSVYLKVVDDADGTGYAWMAVDDFQSHTYVPDPDLVFSNADFETGDLTGWTATEAAFANIGQASNAIWCSGWQDFYYGHSLANGGESATGELQSDPFTLTQQHISFLSAGWSGAGGVGFDYNYVTLHLNSDDSVLDKSYMYAMNSMGRMYLDGGSENIGQEVYIKAVDDGDGDGFAWMAVDEFKYDMPPTPGSTVHGGMYAARLDRREEVKAGDSALDRDSTGLRIPVTGGNTLKFSAWVRTASPGLNHKFTFSAALFQGSTVLENIAIGNARATDEWQEHTFTHTLHVDSNELVVAFRLSGSKGAAIVVDDVSVVDLTAGNSVNLVSNADFETWPGGGDTEPTGWRFFSVNGAEGTITRVYDPPPTPTPASHVDRWEEYR